MEFLDWTQGATSGPALAVARSHHSATLRPDGSLVVVGGNGPAPLASIEILEHAAPQWTAAPPLSSSQGEHTATLLPGGILLVVGTAAEQILPPTGSWQNGPALNTPRRNHSTTLLPDGSVLVVGGLTQATPLSSSERLDAAGWQPTDSLQQPRYNHTATLLPDGSLLVTGGIAGGVPLSSAERYSPALQLWQTTPPLQKARSGHSATLLPTGHLLVVGGDLRTDGSQNAATTSAEQFDPAAQTWTDSASPLWPRSEHSATLLPDGRLLVVGGVGTGLTAPSAAELYDPQTDRWTLTAPMQTLRRGHSATLLPDGTVLVAGGVDPTDETYTVLATTERFDPTTLTWSPAAPLDTPRLHHIARLLPDGTVLVDGGENNSGLAATAEHYHPAQNRWQTLPPPTNGRIGHSAALRLDGTLLIAGGTADFFNELDEVRSWTPPAPQTAPTLTAALYLTAAVQITGDGFFSARHTPSSNPPLLQLRSLDNEQLLWPGLAAAPHSQTLTTPDLLDRPLFLNSPVLATLFVDGAASNALFVARHPPQAPPEALYLPMVVQ